MGPPASERRPLDLFSLRRPHHKTAAHRCRYPHAGGSDHSRPQYSADQYGFDHGSGHSTGSANTGHVVVIVLVINKTHSIVHGVFARCFDGVFGLFALLDPRGDPCVLPLILGLADPGTLVPVAGIWPDPSEFWSWDPIPPTRRAIRGPAPYG